MGVQNPEQTPGGEEGGQGFGRTMLPAKLRFHAGWSGWTKPPTIGGEQVA